MDFNRAFPQHWRCAQIPLRPSNATVSQRLFISANVIHRNSNCLNTGGRAWLQTIAPMIAVSFLPSEVIRLRTIFQFRRRVLSYFGPPSSGYRPPCQVPAPFRTARWSRFSLWKSCPWHRAHEITVSAVRGICWMNKQRDEAHFGHHGKIGIWEQEIGTAGMLVLERYQSLCNYRVTSAPCKLSHNRHPRDLNLAKSPDI